MLFAPQNWALSIAHKGRDREPVVVVDGFAADPAVLVDEARNTIFARDAGHYPGLRAAASPALSAALCVALQPLLQRVFGVANAHMIGCFHSLVTKRPEQLTPIQRLPHFDGVETGRLALILYLSDPAQGGTSFYRHRSTGFEAVTPERFDAYRAALAADVRRCGLPEAQYIGGDTALFERIGGVQPAFNRAAIYRGCNLHSGDIAADFRFDPHPLTGRLTLNAFLLGETQARD